MCTILIYFVLGSRPPMHVATVLWLLPLIAGILLVVVGLCWSFCMCWSPFSKFPLQTAIGKFSGVVRVSRRNGTSPADFSRIGWCCMVLLCAPCPRCLKGTTIAVSGTERLTANSLSTEGRSFEPKPQTLSLRSVSCASDFRPTSGTKSGTSQTTAPCQTLHGLALKPRGF